MQGERVKFNLYTLIGLNIFFLSGIWRQDILLKLYPTVIDLAMQLYVRSYVRHAG